MSRSLAVLLASLWFLLGVAPAETPNLLLITADNLGYGDLGCYGNPDVLTPRLDQLASEGVRCTDFYTGAPSCTPSRATLMTGRYPLRNGLNHQLRSEENIGVGLRLSEKLLPAYLKSAGYATACYGKWNLGFGEGYRPTDRGFDEFFGHASGNCDYYTHVYDGRNDLFRDTESVTQEGYATDLWADAAIDFMKRHQEKPFFVYLPFNAPHFPNKKNKAEGEPVIWQAPDEAFARYGWSPDETDPKRRYYAVITALDTAIGRVLDSLDEMGLADNTLVMWYSDNGAFMLPDRGLEVASNGPLRDGGVTVWEGGIRVPAMVRWPGQIEPGTTCREPLIAMDLFALCLDTAGAEWPQDRTIDGKNPLATLQGKSESPHDVLAWVWTQGKKRGLALRQGDYKLVQPDEGAPYQLYNLREDIGETTDLAGQQDHKERVQGMTDATQKWLSEVPSP